MKGRINHKQVLLNSILRPIESSFKLLYYQGLDQMCWSEKLNLCEAMSLWDLNTKEKNPDL